MSTAGDVIAGVGLLGRGFSLLARRPRLFLLGALPPLVTSVLLTGILVLLLTRVDQLAGWLTPFAGGWGEGLAAALRMLVGLALVAGAVLLMVLTFTALTLALGSPLYDLISESVERELGPVPAPREEPWTAGLSRTVRQSSALIAVSAVGAVLLFLAGFIPVLGQSVVPVMAVVFGGWMLCIELVGATFERSGRLHLADRLAAMRRLRARVLGFSVPTFLLLAVPFAAVVVFPVATAAGTILARDLLEIQPRSPGSR